MSLLPYPERPGRGTLTWEKEEGKIAFSVTQGWDGGPRPGRWDMAVRVCVCVCRQGATMLAVPNALLVPREGLQKRRLGHGT